MRNLKKFLALVLAMVMAFSLMLTANAAVTTNVVYPDANDDVVTPEFVEAVEVLSGMRIFQGDGDDGGFHAGNSITRAEVAAIIYRLVTADVTDSQAPLYRNVNHPFTDVTSEKWYAGYVGYLWNAGIIKGDTATTFNPSGNVTGYEALAMILRAVGYDKQNEFSGSSWYQNVASISKNEGILDDVNKTIYAGTLHSPARRDVVASLLFNTAAYVPQVVWTSAFSYTKTGMTGGPVGTTQNPTLGQKWFGLTWDWGVIVGNEDTGEGDDITRIGFDTYENGNYTGNVSNASYRNGAYYTLGYDYDRNETTESTTESTIVNKDATGIVTGTTTTTATTTTPAGSRNIVEGDALRFKWDSGLDQFGHAVKVWYDYKGSIHDTYYVKDNNVMAEVVVLDNDLNLAGVYTNNGTNLASVARNKGFTLRNSRAWFNYSFGPTGRDQWIADPGATFKSPIKENNSSDNYGLYLLISNSADKNLDMVISLDLTVTQITQQNDTTAPYSVGVTNENGTGSSYFDVEDTATEGADKTYANILQTALVGDSAKKMGDKVVAIEVTGTTWPYNTGDNTDNDNGNFYNANSRTYGGSGLGNVGLTGTRNNPSTSNYYYSLNKLTKVVPGTVVDVNLATNSVTLSDGSVLNRSVLALATDGTFQVRSHVEAPTVYSTYNFTLDADGNYIYWEPINNIEKFVYGTYLDYNTPLNSSVYTYSMVAVGMDGKQVIETPIISYTTAAVPGTGLELNNANNYNTNPLPKRDKSTMSGFVAEGQYVGYTIDASGNLHAVTGEGDGYANTAANPMMMDDGDYFGSTASVVIGERDVAIGAKQIGNTNLFLTNNTQFYLVSGAGTDTQKVAPYKGLTELMNNCTQVTIDGDGNTGSGKAGSLGSNIPYAQMIFFSKSAFTYGQNYDSNAYQVDTVFIPAEAVDRVEKYESNLVFVGDSSSSVISATGEKAVRFTMYNNGVAASYWIAGERNDLAMTYGSPATGTSSAGTVRALGDNVFYRLVATGKTAVDGQPIYNVAPVATDSSYKTAAQNAADIIIGQFYDGSTTVARSSNITAYPALYAATTRDSQVAFIDEALSVNSPLYNTGNATVVNLDTDTYPGINNTVGALNNAGSMTTNTGVPVSCVFAADSDTVVSLIYVNA